jgi:hypothetical protein
MAAGVALIERGALSLYWRCLACAAGRRTGSKSRSAASLALCITAEDWEARLGGVGSAGRRLAYACGGPGRSQLLVALWLGVDTCFAAALRSSCYGGQSTV